MSKKINKDELYKRLDSINQWINNCDSKTSVMIGFIGVLVTIIFTNSEIIHYLVKILSNCFTKVIFSDILFFIFLLSFALMIIYGIALLLKVLIPTLKMKSNKHKSYLYFGSIAKYDSYVEYKNDLLCATENDIIDDLLNQIYQNSLIATNKYHNYTKGVKTFILGFVGFVILYIIGLIIYL